MSKTPKFYNYVARACQTCGAYKTQRENINLGSNLTRINVDYVTSIAIAAELKSKAQEIIENLNNVKGISDLFEGLKVELVKNANASQEGPFVQFPDFRIKYNGNVYEGHASTSACMGDSHSKIFMRLKVKLSNKDNSQDISHICNALIEFFITNHIFPQYQLLLEAKLADYSGSSVDVVKLNYYPIQTVDDLPESIRRTFDLMDNDEIDDLTAEFKSNSQLFNAVKKYILKPLCLFELDTKDDINWDDYVSKKEVELKDCKWKFQVVASGEKSLFLQRNSNASFSDKPNRKLIGVTYPDRSNSVDISSRAMMNSLV